MGTEAIWVPLLIAAASGGVSYYNGQQLEKDQNKVLSQGIHEQQGHQDEINQQTQELLSKFASSNPEADKAQSLAAYQAQLAKNKGVANSGLTHVAGASGDYQTGTQDAALGIADYGNMLSSLMSRIDAPEQQRQREGEMMGDYGVGVDREKRYAQGDEYINQLKLKSLHRNPWLDALSAALKGVGMAGSGGLSSIFGSGGTTAGGIFDGMDMP